jgi:hypothetical protein
LIAIFDNYQDHDPRFIDFDHPLAPNAQAFVGLIFLTRGVGCVVGLFGRVSNASILASAHAAARGPNCGRSGFLLCALDVGLTPWLQ